MEYKIKIEATPNPNSLKFVLNKTILTDGKTADFIGKAMSEKYSPLARELFLFPFVRRVFIASNFVTITKSSVFAWDFIKTEMCEFICDFLQSGGRIITQIPPKREQKVQKKNSLFSTRPKTTRFFEPSVWDHQIKNLMEQSIRPAVEKDGGKIEYLGIENGIVYVQMSGACAGCPGASATLKLGIEALLKQHIKTVTKVEAI